MLLMGRWGTPAPINSPMTVVFGKPIEVPQLEHPSDELVSGTQFIKMQATLESMGEQKTVTPCANAICRG